MFRNCVLLLIVACSTMIFATPDKLVCYLGSWANYRSENCSYKIENIDPNLCTHIIYAFVGITEDSEIRIMDSWLDVDLGALKRFTDLRSQNSELKALVAAGGWNEGSTKFSTMVSSASTRATFIASTITFLQTYGFDGLDMDWEYPAQRGGATTDKVNFSTFLAEMRDAFDEYGFLLTAAVSATAESVDQSYEVSELSTYLDFINVMTYDLHGAWDSVTGHNSPLYASSVDVTDSAKLLNVDTCIKGWIERGADPAKLMLGIPMYGRTFTLTDSSNSGIGAPTSGAGSAGQCTQEAGILGYNEICEKLEAGGWTEMFDDEQYVPYAYSTSEWIGYDNAKSVALKVEYAKSINLGGIMIWSLETDDFNGRCGQTNILLETIRNTLELSTVESQSSSSSTETSNSIEESNSSSSSETASGTTASEDDSDYAEGTSSTTSTLTSTSSGSTNMCSVTGYVRDSDDCSVFYQCVLESGVMYQYRFECASGLYFDPSIAACNYVSLVTC